MKRFWFSLVVIVAILSLAATCPWAQTKPTLTFLLNSQLYLAGIQNLDPALADYFFNKPEAILFTNDNANPIPAGWSSRGAMKFTAFANFQNAISSGGIDPNVTLVIYDNEHWGGSGATPYNEQIAPASFTAQFADLAQSQGYGFIATPSRDLVIDQLDYVGGPIDPYYLATGQYSTPTENRPFPVWAAGAPADIFDIQAQAHTVDGLYVSFATSAANQAVQANPNVKILVGVSTNYGTAEDMHQAVLNTYTLPNVVGYWINLTRSGDAYQQVVDFLNLLKADGF